MRRVFLESPFAGDVAQNIDYARACVRDSLQRGEAPTVPHLLYTQEGILRDEIPQERQLGIAAGFVWRDAAVATVIYIDRGVSRGMVEGVLDSISKNVPIEIRRLDTGPPTAVVRQALNVLCELGVDVETNRE